MKSVHSFKIACKPIRNTAECQVCHGQADTYADPSSGVRAVIALRRSRATIHERIDENRRTAIGVAACTGLAFLILVFVFWRVFGVGVQQRKYGGVSTQSSASSS